MSVINNIRNVRSFWLFRCWIRCRCQWHRRPKYEAIHSISFDAVNEFEARTHRIWSQFVVSCSSWQTIRTGCVVCAMSESSSLITVRCDSPPTTNRMVISHFFYKFVKILLIFSFVSNVRTWTLSLTLQYNMRRVDVYKLRQETARRESTHVFSCRTHMNTNMRVVIQSMLYSAIRNE